MEYEFNDGTLTVPLVENPAPIPLEAHEVRFSTTVGGTTNSKVVRIPYSDYSSITTGSELRRYLFRFTLEDNKALGLSRTIKVDVRAIAADGGEGDWTAAPDAYNPPPEKPQLGVIRNLDQVTFNIIPAAVETDRRSWIVVVSDNPETDPATATPFLADHQGNSFTLDIFDDLPRYVWVAGVDVMGPTELDWSLPVTVTRRSVDEIIDPIIDQIEEVKDDFVTEATDLVAGQLASVGATLLSHENAIQQSLYNNGVPINQFASEVFTRVGEVEASQQQVETQLSAQAGNIAAATTQVNTLASDVQAQSDTITTLVANVEGRISAVETSASANATAIAAEATTRQSQLAQLEDNIASDIQAVTTSVNTERSRIDTQSQQLVQFGDSLGVVSNATTANATAISTETTNRTNQYNTLNGNLSAYKTANDTKVTALETKTTAHQTLLSQHGGSIAAINSELDTIASDLAAEVSLREQLLATVNSNHALFNQQVILQANNHTAQGNLISALTTRVGTAEGTITTLNTAYTNGTIVTVGTTNAISARLNNGDISAGITNAMNVAVDARGTARATWGLSSNVNGLISGISSYNNGTISRLDFMASRIRFMNDAGTVAVVPLEIVGNKVRLKDTEVNGNLIVTGTINNGAIQPNTITSISAAYNGALTNLTGSTAYRAQGVWITVEKATSPVDIFFNALVNYVHNAGGSFSAYVTLWRSNGTTSTALQSFTLFGSGMANDTFQGFVPVAYIDRPGAAGAWHYYVTLATNTSSMSTQTVAGRYMRAYEFKTNTDGTVGTGTGQTGGGGTPPPDTGGGGSDPYDPGTGSCPVPETLITLGDRTTKPAGDIEVGDEVWTQHEHTMEWGAYPVTHVSRAPAQTWVVAIAGGTSIQASTGHLLRKADGEWIEIQDVTAGMKLHGEVAELLVEADADSAGEREVMKITVADAHTYVAAGIVSHNVKPIYVDP